MVSYNSFLKLLEKHLLEYYPGGEDCKIEIHQIQKNNITLDAVHIFQPGSDGNAVPSFYVKQAWERYRATDDLNGVFAEVTKQYYEMASQYPVSIDVDSLLNKENLFCQIVNTRANEERLKNIPHQDSLDLSVICRCLVKNDNLGVSSFAVNYGAMEQMGLSQNEMFDFAMANTFCLFPLKISGLGAMFHELTAGGEGKTEYHDNIYAVEQAWEAGERVFVLTNRQGINGAFGMMDKDFLASVGNILDCNFNILPSSIHEVLLVPADTLAAGDLSELQEMVKQVNHDVVRPDELLSNNVYYFDRNTKELSIAGGRAEELDLGKDASRRPGKCKG